MPAPSTPPPATQGPSTQRVCPECGTQTEALVCPKDGEMTLVFKKKDDPLANRIGEVIAGRHRVIQVIGQGGFGAAFKAQHTATADTVAIKIQRTDVADSQDVVARFRREAKATSKLKHPNTVRVFDFGQMDDGNLYIAMEFLEGRTFTDLMRKEGPIEPRRLVHIAAQVLKALSKAHSKGIVHRDLKPDNIYLQSVHGEPDFVKVLDFGVAKSLAGDTTQGDMTSTGAMLGTPRYMSPEQARGAAVDPRTDLYSLGLILYESLTGVTPFVADSPLSMLLKRVQEEPPRVHDCLALPTPQGVCDVVLRALQREPEERWQGADDMHHALTHSIDTPLLAAKSVVALPAGKDGRREKYTEKYEGQETSEETFADPSQGPGSISDIVRKAAGDVPTGAAKTAVPAQKGATTDTPSKLILTASDGSGAGEGEATIAVTDPSSQLRQIAAKPVTGQVGAVGHAPPLGLNDQATRLESAAALGLPVRAAVAGPVAVQPVPATPESGKSPWIFLGIGGGLTAVVALALVVAMQGQKQPAPQDEPSPPVVAQGSAAALAPAPSVQPGQPLPPPQPAPPVVVPAQPPAPAAVPGIQVRFQREPPEVRIEVDGVVQPGDVVERAAGKHTLMASLGGYDAQKKDVELPAGAPPQTFVLSLQKTGGTAPKPVPVNTIERPKPENVVKPAKPPKPDKPGKADPPPDKPKPKPGGLLID
jgi:serine/threonine protein kinase